MDEPEGEFSFQDMERLKRQAAGSARNVAEPDSAAMGLMNAEVAPQEAFSRSASSDLETVQFQRALRMLQRHWLVVFGLAFFLPTVMFIYDEGLSRLRLPEALRRLGAPHWYISTCTVEEALLPEASQDRPGAATALQTLSSRLELAQVFNRSEFQRELRRRLKDRLADHTSPEALPPEVTRQAEEYLAGGGGISFSADEFSPAGLANLTLKGRLPGLLPVLAETAIPALNEFYRFQRRKWVTLMIEQNRQLRTQNESALAAGYTELGEINRQLDQTGGNDAASQLDRLRQERNQLELEREDLQIQLRLAKRKADYDRLAKRFFLGTEADLTKVAIEGNPLRVEWARLADELAKLRTRYTDEHPAIQNLQSNIAALQENLRRSGGATSRGEVPPLPRPEELAGIAAVSELNDRVELNRERLDHLNEKLQAALDRERASQPAANAPADPQRAALPRRRDELRGQIQYLQTKAVAAANALAELEIAASQINEEKRIEMVGRPGAARLVSPKVWVDVPVALLIGFVLGFGAAVLLESLDTKLHTPADVYYHLRLNYLGVIPRWLEREAQVIAPERPDSHLSEIYAHLCNNIRYGRGGQPQKRLLVASATQGEGKSTMAANLAIRYSLEGNTVILIDADLRRPRGHKLLEVFQDSRTLTYGLADCLAGDASFRDAVYGTTIPGLSLLPAGSRVRNVTKLLSSPALAELLDEAEHNFDIVIVDCPAVLPVVDATILAPHARGVLMVIAADEVEVGAVRMALYRMQHVGAPFVGAVLNKVRERSTSYSYYGYHCRSANGYAAYGHPYGQDEDPDLIA